MIKPINAMIAGAPKSGTTSLVHYLATIPSIATHQTREMNYFVSDRDYGKGYLNAFERYFDADETTIVLAKSAALMYSNLAIKRLHDHNPNTLVICLLRHPVERAYSAYWFARRRGWETAASFERAILIEDEVNGEIPYISQSIYAPAVQAIKTVFTEPQPLFFLLSEFKEQPHHVISVICSALGIEASYSSLHKDNIHNTSSAARSEWLARQMAHSSAFKQWLRSTLPDPLLDRIKSILMRANEVEFTAPPMDHDTRLLLTNYFEPHNQQLAFLLDRNLEHWS